jgi:predicted transposase/invertase (TIGR01784 family)
MYKLMECHSDPIHILIDKEEFHFVDVGRVEEIAKIESNEKLIHWMKFLKSTTREEMKVLAEHDVCIGRAVQTLEVMSLDENEVYQAWAREKFLWDQEVRERGAEERGREEGKIEGKIEGIEIGEKRGKIETAKAMLAKGIDIKIICEVTGLDVMDFKDE